MSSSTELFLVLANTLLAALQIYQHNYWVAYVSTIAIFVILIKNTNQ